MPRCARSTLLAVSQFQLHQPTLDFVDLGRNAF